MVASFFVIARGFRVWWQVFSGGKRLVCAHVLCARVGLWELMKQRLLRSFSLLVGGFEQSVFVFWFVLLFGMLLGVWGNTGLLFYRITPLYRQDLFGWVLFVGWCVV